MRVVVLGLGYVGCVTAACLADMGHEVAGVDVDPSKVEALSHGRAPFFEPGLDELVSTVVAAGRLKAGLDERVALEDADLALVCVGTPSNSDGSIRTDYLKSVLENLGNVVRGMGRYFPIALRSTVLPNVISGELIPLLERSSGQKLGSGFGLVCNPEFLRQGSALQDFREPPWTLIGAYDARAGDVVTALYAPIPGPVVRTDPATALLVKYASNAFHALKVSFANEVGEICGALSVSSHGLMDIFCGDTKLNISAKYLRPGFAFGGSCLPKDLKALLTEGRRRGLELPVLSGILPSNERHLHECLRLIAETGKKKVALVGLAFKGGTDDLRESASVQLAIGLLREGYDLRIFEPHISPSSIRGTNLSYIEKAIPHVWDLLADNLEAVIRATEVIVLTQPLDAAGREAFRVFTPDQICLDFVGTLQPRDLPAGVYRGLSW